LALGFFWALGTTDSVPLEPEVQTASVPQVESEQQAPAVEAVTEGVGQAKEESGASLRTAIESADVHLKGLVMDESGAPVEGAQVTLTAWLEDFVEIEDQWMPVPDEDLQAVTLQQVTGPDGAFWFRQLPEGGAGRPLVLWATHPGHQAQGLALAPGESVGPTDEPLDLQMKSAAKIDCRVTNLGQPAEGAEVHQRFAVTPSNLYLRDPELPNAEWAFLRTAEADASGALQLGALAESMRLTAHLGELESMPWRGLPKRPVALELLPTFTVEGVAEVLGPVDDSWGGFNVEIMTELGGRRETLHQCRLRKDGTFGPERVPLVTSGQGLASIMGGNLLPNAAPFDLPGPGGRVALSLSAKAGTIVWFAAYDAADKSIPTATARAFWFDGGRVETREFPAEPNGMIAVPVIPEGMVGGVLSAPGFADAELVSFRVPEAEVIEHWVTLERARALRGRCVADGKPVTDFTVNVWAPWSPLLTRKIQVAHSEDGVFETDRAPTRDLAILAFAPSVGVSDVVYLSHDDDTEPTLELVTGLRAHGRLVDSFGEPIPGIRVAPVLPVAELATREIAPAVESDANGFFEVGGLPTGGGKLLVSAPDYVRRTLVVDPDPELDVELGDVLIEHAQTLHVRAQLPTGSSKYSFFSLGTDAFPPTRMPNSGVLDIAGVAPGSHDFVLQNVETQVSAIIRKELKAGEWWELDYDLVSHTGLRVSYIGDEQAGAFVLTALRTYSKVGLVSMQARFNLAESREVVFPRFFEEGDVLLTLDDLEGGRKSIKRVHIDPQKDYMPVEIDLGHARASIRAVGPQGKPVESLKLQIFEPGSSLILGWAGTDGDGGVVFPGVEPGSYCVFGWGASGGQAAWDMDVPPSGDEPVVLQYDPLHELSLHLTEEGEPVAGLHGKLSFALNEFTFGTTEDSAGDGTMNFEHLQAGAYSVEVTGDDVMPETIAVTVPSQALGIEVYSRTSFTIRLLSAEGAPLGGQDLSLFHEGLGIDLAQGLGEGWATSATGALVTDAAGRLELKGVPRGVYSWTVGGASGSFEVSRDGSSVIPIVLE